MLQWAAHLSPQVLAGEGVAQWPFVAAPAACRNGLWPKYRRKCLRHKELENPARSARRSKEFRPPEKHLPRRTQRNDLTRQGAKRRSDLKQQSERSCHFLRAFAPSREKFRCYFGGRHAERACYFPVSDVHLRLTVGWLPFSSGWATAERMQSPDRAGTVNAT